MAAPKGNEYYKLRGKDGRNKKYETPEDLLKACNEYFEWCQENPLKEEMAFHSQGLITKTEVSKLRAFTLQGLCNFIDMSIMGFMLYEDRKDFVEVTTRVREIIYLQKFEGSAANMLNANIIARDLGLADKKDHTSKGDKIGISPITWVDGKDQ